MTITSDHDTLISILSVIDIYHEFKDKWLDDIPKLQMFIEIHIGNFLPDGDDTFGSYLRKLRDFKGLTNVELARRTGLSESTISKYLSDGGRTKESTLALMIAFELEPQQVDAVFSLAELRIDRKNNYNDIVNHFIRIGGSNAVAECNQALIMFGYHALTLVGLDAKGK